MGEVLFEYEPDSAIAIVTLKNPPFNAIDRRMWNKLPTIFEQISEDDKMRVAVIRGAGSVYFSSGADISEFPDEMDDDAAVHKYFKIVDRANSTVAACPKPVIAMIRGVALGPSLALAVACDLRIAADDARLGIPNNLGVTLGLNDINRLVNVVGAGRAKEILVSGEWYKAREAYTIGLVSEVVEPKNLQNRTMLLASRIAASAPLALKSAKAGIDIVTRNPKLLGIDGTEMPVNWQGSDDLQEGVNSYFKRRSPHFRDS